MTSVLFVLNSAGGGAAISAMELMRGLGRRGYRCFAVCPPSPEEALRPIRSIAADVATVALPWWNKNYKSRWYKRPAHFALSMLESGFHAKSVAAVVRLIRRWGIDLVHSNTSVTLDGALASMVARIPHVWHIREQIGARGLFRFWLPEPALARTFVALSNALIVNSNESRAFFARNGVGDRVSVVYNGVPIDDFDRPNRGAELKKQWAGDRVLVGMVANLSSRMKRHDVFLHAASRVARAHPEVRFAVIGHDPDRAGGYRSETEYARKTKALAKELGLEAHVTFTGHVDDVPSIMGALDLLVHPSDQESFGRVAVEAMAARKPVIASDSGGLREIVDHGTTGFRVRPNDPEAFAEAMCALLDRREQMRAMGEAGRVRAEQLFSLDSTVSGVERTYERART